jgi:ATP-binding cassette subfamily B protein
MDIGFFEKPSSNLLHQARADAATVDAILKFGSALQNGITCCMAASAVWLPPALLVSTLPAFYVVVRASRRYHTWWNDSTVTRRRIQYFDVLLTEPFSAGEVRLFGLGGHFQAAYQTLRSRFRKERLISHTTIPVQARRGARRAGHLRRRDDVDALPRVSRCAHLGDLALFYQAFQRGQDWSGTLPRTGRSTPTALRLEPVRVRN